MGSSERHTIALPLFPHVSRGWMSSELHFHSCSIHVWGAMSRALGSPSFAAASLPGTVTVVVAVMVRPGLPLCYRGRRCSVGPGRCRCPGAACSTRAALPDCHRRGSGGRQDLFQDRWGSRVPGPASRVEAMGQATAEHGYVTARARTYCGACTCVLLQMPKGKAGDRPVSSVQ